MIAQSHTCQLASERLTRSSQQDKMSAKAEERLRGTDLARATKATMVALCEALDLDKSGRKAQLENRLRAKIREIDHSRSNDQARASSIVRQPPDQSQSATQQAVVQPPASSAALQSTDQLLQSIAQHAATLAVAKALGLPHGQAPLPPGLHQVQQPTTPYLQQPLPLAVQPTPAPAPSAITTSLPTSLPTTTTGNSAPAPQQPLTTLPLYQPPAATAQEVQSLQASLAAQQSPLAAACSTAIPALPNKLTGKILSGEFVDYGEILHALEADTRHEQPTCIQVGEGQQLVLSRRPRRREVTDIDQWVRCFSAYTATICTHQPIRAPDLLAYQYVITSAYSEYKADPTRPWLAYDTAFRQKAARYHTARWGEIDPQLYTKAFTGKKRVSSCCLTCLSPAHITNDCPLQEPGPSKKARVQPPEHKSAIPKHHGREVCLNWNRGRCSNNPCPRAHVCLVKGCQGEHRAYACPTRRTSPRKRS